MSDTTDPPLIVCGRGHVIDPPVQTHETTRWTCGCPVRATDEDARLVLGCLIRLVRNEHPPGYSLADIANIWGEESDPRVLDALRRIEGL